MAYHRDDKLAADCAQSACGAPNPYAADRTTVVSDGRDLAVHGLVYHTGAQAVHSYPFPIGLAGNSPSTVASNRLEILKMAIDAAKHAQERNSGHFHAESVIQWAQYFEAFLTTGKAPPCPSPIPPIAHREMAAAAQHERKRVPSMKPNAEPWFTD
jgi:hypothetical protein